jgi:PadR family transcriptional regulator PadR
MPSVSADKLKGHLDPLLMAILAGKPGHGYAIICELRDRTTGTFDLAEGTVYPALHRLQDAGLLTSDWEDVGGRRRRVYRLTDDGSVALAAERQHWRRFADAMDQILHAGRLQPA